jgi:hypothetical protein
VCLKESISLFVDDNDDYDRGYVKKKKQFVFYGNEAQRIISQPRFMVLEPEEGQADLVRQNYVGAGETQPLCADTKHEFVFLLAWSGTQSTIT